MSKLDIRNRNQTYTARKQLVHEYKPCLKPKNAILQVFDKFEACNFQKLGVFTF